MPDFVDEHGRVQPPLAGDEAATLLGFLDYQRETLAWKCGGLGSAGLTTKVAASQITLGGLLKHMALVEDWWFSQWLMGEGWRPPFDAVDWEADPDWEWRTAAVDSPEDLVARWQASVERSREHVAKALQEGGMGLSAKKSEEGWGSPSLRWIICHMIEEYARHNGHADLIRESVDGETGE